MASKDTTQKAEKAYTYEEYRKAFCADSGDTDTEAENPTEFGVQLAKEALARIDRNTGRAKDKH